MYFELVPIFFRCPLYSKWRECLEALVKIGLSQAISLHVTEEDE